MTLADIYEEYEGRLRRYAMSLVQDSDRSDDLVQETFIRAMAHLELLGQLNRHQRQAWLFRVMKNRFIDEQRARQRRQDLAVRLSQEAWFSVLTSADEMGQDLFESIPERYRELLHQRYVLSMNSTEIGREMSIPAATVRSRLHLAIKWLRAHQAQVL